MYSPDYETFMELAKQGNLVPVTRRLLADFETPLSAYHKIRGQGESFLFESVEGGEHLGRYSFLGCNPRAVVRQTGNHVEVPENGKLKERIPVLPDPKSGATAAATEFEMVERSMKMYGKVDEFTMAYAQSGAAPVGNGLEVIERVMEHHRPVSRPGCRGSPAAPSALSATNSSTTSSTRCPARRTTI